jgi:hypothetical protein
MAHGKNSKAILKWVNYFMMVLGSLVIGVSVYAWADPDRVLSLTSLQFPSYVFIASAIFGVLISIISFLGSCSAKTDSKAGFAFYIFIVFVALVGQITVATYVGMKYDLIHKSVLVTADIGNDAYDHADVAVKEFEEAIVEFATNPSHAIQWEQTQDLFQCCGYDTRYMLQETALDDHLDTGAKCTSTQGVLALAAGRAIGSVDLAAAEAAVEAISPGFFCKDEILTQLETSSLWVGIGAGILAFIQLVCLCAASRLACCVSKKDGGHMEEWRPSKRSQEYECTNIAGTRPGAAGGPMV